MKIVKFKNRFIKYTGEGLGDPAWRADIVDASDPDVTAYTGEMLAHDAPGMPWEGRTLRVETSDDTNRAYLAETDWYVVRQMDAGTPIPDEVKAKRKAAREAIVD